MTVAAASWAATTTPMPSRVSRLGDSGAIGDAPSAASCVRTGMRHRDSSGLV